MEENVKLLSKDYIITVQSPKDFTDQLTHQLGSNYGVGMNTYWFITNTPEATCKKIRRMMPGSDVHITPLHDVDFVEAAVNKAKEAAKASGQTHKVAPASTPASRAAAKPKTTRKTVGRPG